MVFEGLIPARSSRVVCGFLPLAATRAHLHGAGTSSNLDAWASVVRWRTSSSSKHVVPT